MSAPLAAPFPYFGGKRRAASLIWAELGDPSGYVEPFAGSAAVLLARPRFTGRRVETLNDSDGWLVNGRRRPARHRRRRPLLPPQTPVTPVTRVTQQR